jgi:hypothetical protein
VGLADAGLQPADRVRGSERTHPESTLLPPSSFQCLRVTVGNRTALAGVRRGDVTLSLSLSNRETVPSIRLALYGLDTVDRVARRWLHLDLAAGDRVVATVLEVDAVDPPLAAIPASVP